MGQRALFAVLLLGALLAGCGTTSTTAGGEVPLATVFDGGSYRCTVQGTDGEFSMVVEGKRFRYDVTGKAPLTMIAEYGDASTTTYTYLAQQDKWFKFTFPNADPKRPTLVTKENLAGFPRYRCERAEIADSEFDVPQDKVVEQPTIPQR